MSGSGWCSAGLPAQNLDDIIWIILDTETSGLDPARDELLELAANVLNSDGCELDMIAWRREDGAAAYTNSVTSVVDWLDSGATLVAHNIGFDLSFLEQAAGWRMPARWLCTMQLAGGGASLDALAARVDVAARGRHTADGDAATLTRILGSLIARARSRGLATVAGLAVVCPVVARAGPPPTAGTAGWPAVRAALDLVAPIDFLDRQARLSFAAIVRSLPSGASGPTTPRDHALVVAALADRGISALALGELLAELQVQIPAQSENSTGHT